MQIPVVLLLMQTPNNVHTVAEQMKQGRAPEINLSPSIRLLQLGQLPLPLLPWISGKECILHTGRPMIQVFWMNFRGALTDCCQGKEGIL